MENTNIFTIYNGLEEDVKSLKNKVMSNLKNELKSLGFRLVAEWIDYKLPIIYNDILLVSINNNLFQVKLSAGNKQITIGRHTFAKFDTINKSKLSRDCCKSLYGYKIDKENCISLSGIKFSFKDKSLVYRDLLRIEKISKLLEN